MDMNMFNIDMYNKYIDTKHKYISLCNNKLLSPIWGSNEIKIWEFILFAILIIYPNWITLFITLTIILPVIYLFVGGSYGSLWCAITNICAIYYLYKY